MRRFLAIFAILLVGVGFWYFFSNQTKDSGTSQEAPQSGFKAFFSRNTIFTPEEVGNSTNTKEGTSGESSENIFAPVSAFKKISPGTVAGVTHFSIKKTVSVPNPDPKLKPTQEVITEHFIRYVSRVNGYVYEIKDEGIPTQITNIYIPNVYEASFADGGKTAIVRFLRDDLRTIATYSVPIPEANPDGTRTQRTGVYFPENVSSLAVSTDGKSVARVLFENSTSSISTTDTKNEARKELIKNPFEQWLVSWGGASVYLQTKATAFADGFLYRIDAQNKRLVRILGDMRGLTTSVSPKGTYILYSESRQGSGFISRVYETKTGITKGLSVIVLPEKCTWLLNEDLICAGSDSVAPGNYPDEWYDGTRSFTDTFYHIHTATNRIDTLSEDESKRYDAISLVANEAQTLLYFIDKKTGFLWQLDY